MRTLIVAALMAAGPAFADRVAKQGDDEVRLMDKACPYASVLRFIPENQRSEYQKAEGRFQGKRYFACWLDVGNGVHLYWEDGDQGFVPSRDIKDDQSI